MFVKMHGNNTYYVTASDAKSMLKKAAIELRSGVSEAIAKFNNPTGPYRHKDLYVFCFDMKTGKMTAACDQSLLGVDIRTLKDAAGSLLGADIFNAAIEGNISVVDFKWPRPGSSNPVPTEAFVTRVFDQGCGVGYYEKTDDVARQDTNTGQPLVDSTIYGSGKDDATSDITENAATTQHHIDIDGKKIDYQATAGHLVAADVYSGQPMAKFFYVSFTADVPSPADRAVTFFYNGGPGSSSVFLLLGSFGPRRIKTKMPDFTPPAPYRLENNPDCLLDQSDLVFINPIGTGYSTAVAPRKNSDFWGVDQDARSIKQFIKRYLTVFDRWNSPKFLFGESYGTPRTCVLTWLLHEDGVDLNGVILQSSVLDYSQTTNPIGLLPTLAADAYFHGKVTLSPPGADFSAFLTEVEEFAKGPYALAKAAFPKIDDSVLQKLSDILGVPSDVVKYWRIDPSSNGGSVFLTSLLLEEGLAVGSYDGRVTAKDTGIAANIDPNSGSNDPTMTAVGGVYTAMWNVYLKNELKYVTVSPFMDLNDQAFLNWDFGHVDPTGAQKGGSASLYTAGDIAAAIALNPYLKVFAANGIYDAVTPYFQTKINFENMPISDTKAFGNITIRNYRSGHMIYLDDESRSAMKKDLVAFFESTKKPVFAFAKDKSEHMDIEPAINSIYRRRASQTPY